LFDQLLNFFDEQNIFADDCAWLTAHAETVPVHPAFN